MPNTMLTLDHVALPMFDPAKTRAFYRDVLGLSLVSALDGPDWEGRRWLMVIFADHTGREVALCAFDGPQPALDGAWPADARHYAFGAPDLAALSAWKDKLAAAGIETREEDHGHQRSIYFTDPNGTTLEITTRVRSQDPQSTAQADALIDAWLAPYFT